MKRREFIKLSLAAILGSLAMTAEAKSEFYRTDFHAHAILPSYIDALRILKIDAVAEEGFPLPKWSIEEHLRFMSEAGIDFTILSMAKPHISDYSAVRAINEEFSAICKRFPEKFGFAATLPLPNVEESIKEFYYSTEKLKSVGVKVASNSEGIYLGDERLDPIFAELNRKNALIIIHPSPARLIPRENVVTGRVMALFEYPADTTRAILNILANKTLEKFPNLRFIVPHCGSFVPYMKQRAGAMFQMLSAMNLMESVDFSASLSKLYFDTAGDPMPEQFEMLLKVASVDKIVFGTDYPYVPAQIVLKKKKIFDEELIKRGLTEKIYRNNAKILLGG